jgi:hypothetical protein
VKKLLLLLVSICLLSNSAWATDYCASAVGCWLFREGGTSTTVEDSSPNTNTGNFRTAGDPAWSAMSGTSAPSYATYRVSFTRGQSYIQITDSDSMSPSSAMTITQWINPDNVYAGGWAWLMLKWSDPSTEFHYALRAGKLSLYLNTSSGGATEAVYGATTLSTNVWQHTAVVWDGTNAYAYINGVQDGSTGSKSGTVTATTSNVALGAKNSLTTYDGFSGYMSESGRFNTALTSTDINAIYSLGLSPSASPSVGSILNDSVWNDTRFN